MPKHEVDVSQLFPTAVKATATVFPENLARADVLVEEPDRYYTVVLNVDGMHNAMEKIRRAQRG